MVKIPPKVVMRAAGAYLKEHPEEIVRALRGAVGFRFGLPMDAIRYAVRELATGKRAPRDVIVEAVPPGVRLSATVNAMGTDLRVSLIVFVEELGISGHEIRIGTRISDMSLQVLGDAESPLAGLIKSGALDLTKPGNLVNVLPKTPSALLDAKDDRVTWDLMKVPRIAENPRVRRMLAVLTPIVGVRAIKTKDDHLDVHFKADFSGIPAAFAAARGTV